VRVGLLQVVLSLRTRSPHANYHSHQCRCRSCHDLVPASASSIEGLSPILSPILYHILDHIPASFYCSSRSSPIFSSLHSLPVLILFFTGVFVFALSPDEYRPFHTSRHSFQTVTACPFISGSLFFSFTNTAPGSLKVPPSNPPQRKCDVLAGEWRSRARLLCCRYCNQRAIRGGKC
jgi:hypothetical protein